MSWQLTNEEKAEVVALSPEARYEYFVQKTITYGKIWSLRNEEGWVLGETVDDLEAIPVWPHPEFALACATGPWAGHEAAPIELEAFLERFVPGMMDDGRVLAVFEVPGQTAFVIAPDEVGDELDIAVD